MNREDPRHQADERDDGDIRELMRESDYPGKAREEFKRGLLRELNHNFTYHRVRSRALAAVVVVAGALVVTTQVTDVGSDGFGLLPTGSTAGGREIVETPFTNHRFALPESADREAALAEVSELYAQIVAGELVLDEVAAWTMGGETSFTVIYELPAENPGKKLASRSGAPREHSRLLVRFLNGMGAAFLDSVESGALPPAATEMVPYEGLLLPMERWSRDVPGYGPVVYRRFVAPPGFGLNPAGR